MRERFTNVLKYFKLICDCIGSFSSLKKSQLVRHNVSLYMYVRLSRRQALVNMTKELPVAAENFLTSKRLLASQEVFYGSM
jgi:hypothetical protein